MLNSEDCAIEYLMAKYYTNYCFEGYLPTEYHCTHAYLGELNEDTLGLVTTLIQDYFRTHRLDRVLLEFSDKDFFGVMYDIEVLRLNPSQAQLLHLDLRNKLLQFSSSVEYPEYQPHITTTDESFSGRINRYSLIKKEDQIVEEVLVIPVE